MSLIAKYQPVKRRTRRNAIAAPDPDPLLTIEQAAGMLMVSKRTLGRWLEREPDGVLNVSAAGSERRHLRIRLSAVRRLQRKMLV